MPNAADAEDVLQRALLRAAVGADSLADESRARAWFFRILRRAIADYRRGEARDAARVGEGYVDLAAASETPGEGCACGERLLRELPAAYADLLRRVDVEEMPVTEAARALRITPGNAHVRLHRARRVLRARVEATCGVTTLREALACECRGCS